MQKFDNINGILRAVNGNIGAVISYLVAMIKTEKGWVVIDNFFFFA